MFRIERALDDTRFECDRSATGQDLECSYMFLQVVSDTGVVELLTYGETVAAAPGLNHGWSMLSGIIQITTKLVNHKELHVIPYGTHQAMNVFYDDFNIVPIPRSCQNLVLNGDFEAGNTRLWKTSSMSHIDVGVFALGANGSQYSVMTQPMQLSYNGHRIGQDLDTRCLEEGQEFLISAKFRLLDSTDLASGVDCVPSDRNVASSNHCPTVTIRGSGCTGGNAEFLYWNDIPLFQWDPDGFNNYEKVFTVSSFLASCDVSNLLSLCVTLLPLDYLSCSTHTHCPIIAPMSSLLNQRLSQ